MDSVLGIARLAEEAAPAAFQSLLEQRQAARKARDFKRADAIRDELKAQGWAIEDTAKGARLKRL
jgi:cysteinyl-tRNA synthetase